MISKENRLAELAGISREEWEWEQRAEEREANYRRWLAQAAEIEPFHYEIPPKIKEQRQKIAAALSAAWPYQGSASDHRIIMRLAPWMLAIVDGFLVNGHIMQKIGTDMHFGEPERVCLADERQRAAAQLFVDSGFAWAAFVENKQTETRKTTSPTGAK
jgi:hypothetical protein